MEEISGECYFVIKKKGKLGALCTNEQNAIPAIFEGIDKITKYGLIFNKILFDRKGKEIFVLGNEYVYLETKYYDVFMGVGTKDDYKFFNSQGKQVSYKQDEDNEYILILDGGRCFDTEENVFVEEEEDYYDGYDYEDNYNYERDTYYALGGDDYDQWKENGGDLDGMMEGMGF